MCMPNFGSGCLENAYTSYSRLKREIESALAHRCLRSLRRSCFGKAAQELNILPANHEFHIGFARDAFRHSPVFGEVSYLIDSQVLGVELDRKLSSFGPARKRVAFRKLNEIFHNNIELLEVRSSHGHVLQDSEVISSRFTYQPFPFHGSSKRASPGRDPVFYFGVFSFGNEFVYILFECHTPYSWLIHFLNVLKRVYLC